MKFNREKHKLLPLGQRTPGNDTGWGWTCWDQFFGKGPGAQWAANWAWARCTTWQQMQPNSIVGYMNRSIATRSWVIPPSIQHLLVHVCNNVPNFGHPNTRNTFINQSSTEWHKDGGGWRTYPVKRGWGMWDLFSLKQRQLQRHVTAACECLQGGYRGDGTRLFTRCMQGTKWEDEGQLA